MYHQYFGLQEAPFSIAVNPRYLFMSARHRDALAHLLYGVGAGGGFILLTGEVGTGKTTINRCLLEQLPSDTDVAIVLNPALNAMELLATVCDELDIDYDRERHTLKTLTDELHRFLLDNHQRGRKTVLLIDEAQHLDFDVLEQIRLLTNLETNSEKLLQIILIGQPELAQMLARPELRQLNQRITARYNLEPLNQEETGAYIHHRLQVAGMAPERVIFPPGVVRGIYRTTRGIPRLINVLCDRMLLGAYGRNRVRADRSMLWQAAREVLGQPQRDDRRWLWLALAVPVVCAALVWWWLAAADAPAELPAAHAPASPASGATAAASPPPSNLAPVLAAPGAPEGVAMVAPGETTGSGAVASTDSAPVGTTAENQPAGLEAITAGSAPVDVTLPEAALPEATAAAAADAAVTARGAPAEGTPVVLVPLTAAQMQPGEALPLLWKMHSETPPAGCPRTPVEGIVCSAGEAGTWDELARFDRPVALSLVTPERFASEVLLLGVEAPNAYALTPDGLVQLRLAELGPLWTGSYRYLWRPPPGYVGPLAMGDTSPVVAEVARRFAQLDQREPPLADQDFNAALQQRVRLFQQQNGLVADGVVGEQTLLRLNEQLGIDLTAAAARRWLSDSTVAVGGPT